MSEMSETIRIDNPPVLSVLTIAPDFQLHSTSPMPNAWRRFWLKVLLGWRWEARHE